MADDETRRALTELIAGHRLGVLATLKRDGRPQLSTVIYDATVAELVDLYRTVQGEHPDWADYRRAMVAERRLVLRLHVERLYGAPPHG
ncbi:pyridoxamine 5'-phosphate oxidase family protein [Micromonospora sp. NPDC002717]|uniref:pyridoxamine 5'-phosphate oxidase family protein n=1 Tax=Micromonospora sp. NPDC002717 TaxID=3154424 RepID=UPI0033187046